MAIDLRDVCSNENPEMPPTKVEYATLADAIAYLKANPQKAREIAINRSMHQRKSRFMILVDCDKCKKRVETERTQLVPKSGPLKGHPVDLCLECAEKFVKWLGTQPNKSANASQS